jgi:VIT1/CCC1 family predicted Fe2+/Mn2+ transporter
MVPRENAMVPQTHAQTHSEADLHRFKSFWRDEVAAAALYRELAVLVEGERRSLLLELAASEARHAAHWAGLLKAAGRDLPLLQRSRPWRHRLLLLVGRRFGVDRVLPAVIRAKGADRDRYRASEHAAPWMAEEEAAHGRALALASTDNVGEALGMADARHRTSAGGSLRAGVFGANDGLVSNFALIMGVAGGTGDPGVILLAGIAGLVAGAGSMAAGEWVSVRSQRELYERELEVERWELEEFPDDEQHELELIYRAKGLDEEPARELARAIMADPEVSLDTLAREELGLNPGDLGSPWTAAISSFLAFAAGALVPLVPFLFANGTAGLVASAVLSALALAAVGAAISLFTGRSAWRSGLRMVFIGGGAALATFAIGSVVGVSLD